MHKKLDFICEFNKIRNQSLIYKKFYQYEHIFAS